MTPPRRSPAPGRSPQPVLQGADLAAQALVGLGGVIQFPLEFAPRRVGTCGFFFRFLQLPLELLHPGVGLFHLGEGTQTKSRETAVSRVSAPPHKTGARLEAFRETATLSKTSVHEANYAKRKFFKTLFSPTRVFCREATAEYLHGRDLWDCVRDVLFPHDAGQSVTGEGTVHLTPPFTTGRCANNPF